MTRIGLRLVCGLDVRAQTIAEQHGQAEKDEDEHGEAAHRRQRVPGRHDGAEAVGFEGLVGGLRLVVLIEDDDLEALALSLHLELTDALRIKLEHN